MQQSALGGAALLRDLLRELATSRTKSKGANAPAVDWGFHNPKIFRIVPNGYCLMQPFVKAPDNPAKKKEQVWRMADALGFDSSEPVDVVPAVDQKVLDQDHGIVAVDDAGLSFRRWPNQAAWPQFLVDSSRRLPEWLVIKMSSPVAASDLWHTLVSGKTQENTPRAVRKSEELLSRTVLIISIHDLRVEPIQITGNLSWERAAFDLLNGFRSNPRLAGQRRPRCVIVNLGSEAALIAESHDGQDAKLRLVFDPARVEGDFYASLPGRMIGFQASLTAAVIAHLPAPASTNAQITSAFERGVRAGLCGMRRLLIEGHGPVESDRSASKPAFPFRALAHEILAEKHDWSFGAVSVPDALSRSDQWSIVAGTEGIMIPPGPLWGLARRVAKHGLKQLHETPYLQFGKLFAIDRTEIESLRALQRLLIRYRNDPKATKPLSIAAFGPPGSGKSFGVKQLAKAVLAADTPLLEFNLSQFEEAGDLHGLLHQVRDEVLKGMLPIVFWDEFDSQNLKWLQYLLAPMQDGAFQQGEITHPIGKCVFVFAGGTCHRFEDFGEPQSNPDAVAKKAPDFKSRLSGYLNVLGPNRHDDQDITFPVRRALLLRVHLGVDPQAPLAIDDGLVNAFLKIDYYRHGARSLEKIAEHVRQSSRTTEYQRSALPPFNQLNLHVAADEFLTLVEHET